MANEEGATVKFGGDAAGMIEASRKAAESVQSAVESMKASLEGLNSKFELIGKGFAMVSAAVAGGKELKEFVNVAEEVTHSAMSLGKALGMNATDASVFKGALNELGVSQDAVALAGKRITMALAAGGDKFAALGIATKDANGQFRSSKDLMLDVNEKLRGFKEGTDRNIEAQKIYGRSYQDLMPLITKFTDISADSAAKQGVSHEEASKQMDEARERAEALNLVVGQESVDATKAYDKAQRGLREVFEGVQRTVGEALLPKLTAMANFFSEEGPTAVTIMRGVMDAYLVVQDAVKDAITELVDVVRDVFSTIGQVIADVFGRSSEPMSGMQFFANVLTVIKVAVQAVGLAVREAMNVIGGAIKEVVVTFRLYAQVWQAVFVDHSWAGVKAAWQKWGSDTVDIVKSTIAKGVDMAKEGAEKMQATLMADPTARKKVTEAKGKSTEGADSPGKSAKGNGENAVAKAQAEAALAIKKEQLAEEAKATELSYQQQIMSVQKFFAEKQKNEQAAIDAEIEAKQKELAASKAEAGAVGSDAAKLNALKAQQAKLEGDLEVLSMKRRQVGLDTNDALMKAEQDLAKKMQEESIANSKKLVEIDLAARQDALANAKEMGEITAAEELAGQRSLLEAKYQNELKALNDSLALQTFDRDARAKIQDQIAQLNAQHNADMAKNTMATAAAVQKDWQSVISPMAQTFASGLDAMRKKTMTFKDFLGSIYNQMWKMFADWIAKQAAQWAAKEAALTAAQVTGDGVRTTSATTAATTTGTVSSASTMVQIGNHALTAASGSYSAMASIPYIGPILGAAAAVTALGAIMAYKGSVKSARGGYDIPAGVNPLTQLHEEEMVLPKGPANALRDIAENGAGGGGQHLHVHAIDAKGVRQFFAQNGHHIVAAMRGQNAKFGLV